MEEEDLMQYVEDESVKKDMGIGGYPENDYSGLPDDTGKITVFSLFKDFITARYNKKTANLTKEELGMARLPVRTDLELANYCKVMGMDAFANVFEDEAQIKLATSLSRDGFLPKLAVTQKKFTETNLRRGQGIVGKKGLFGGGQQPPQEPV